MKTISQKIKTNKLTKLETIARETTIFFLDYCGEDKSMRVASN